MKFLFIETYCRGSHAQFIEGLTANSSHEIDVLTMPGENWRWRMLGAALQVVENLPPLDVYHGIVVTDMFNLADFKAFIGSSCPPVILYFHENQITYPQPPGDKAAFQLGIINITSALAADKVLFNSQYHREAFLDAVPDFLHRVPDFKPKGVAEKIRSKSKILYPGISFPKQRVVTKNKINIPPLIIWNHRWGYDKNYDAFFHALEAVDQKGIDFRIAILGEHSGPIEKRFESAKEIFKEKILQFGYVTSRKDYLNWLSRGDFVISTAIQENFGIAVIEAMMMGCIPLLPNRLSYPEILPQEYHEAFLYENHTRMIEKLAAFLTRPEHWKAKGSELPDKMASFSWNKVIEHYDSVLKNFATQNR